MKKYVLVTLSFILLAAPPAYAVKGEVVQLLERPIPLIKPPTPVEEKERVSVTTYYDYGRVSQGQRWGNWKLLTENISYAYNDYITPYFEFDYWDRFHDKDYAYIAGSYFRFKNTPAYLRTEFGWGAQINYLYRFQSTVEYSHRMAGTLYWQAGYRFLNYAVDDVYIFYPGLIYYFGDNYVALNYNMSITESRGKAYWGSLRGSCKINKYMNCYGGGAIGQRLYDIYVLPANKQYSYILFGGFEFPVNKNISLRLGGSYSMENPSFIKRSADGSLNIKF